MEIPYEFPKKKLLYIILRVIMLYLPEMSYISNKSIAGINDKSSEVTPLNSTLTELSTLKKTLE